MLSLSHEALWFLFFRLCRFVFLVGETRHVWTVDISGLTAVNVFLLKVYKVFHFQGVYFPVSFGEGSIFSLDALLIKIHKPPRADLTAAPLFKLFFSKNYSSKVREKKKKAKTICKLVTTWLALGLLQREKPTLPQLNLFEHRKTVYRVQTQYFSHFLKYSLKYLPPSGTIYGSWWGKPQQLQ